MAAYNKTAATSAAVAAALLLVLPLLMLSSSTATASAARLPAGRTIPPFPHDPIVIDPRAPPPPADAPVIIHVHSGRPGVGVISEPPPPHGY
jgi:hypothetical protein